jgi:maltose O-acetyltransferase
MDVEYYRSRGAVIGENVHIGPDCRLDPSTAYLVTIGDDVVFAPAVQLLAHDASLWRRIGYTKLKHTRVGSHVFVGANTLILPGVTIGDDVVIGAGSVVTRDIPSNSLAYGNPATVRMNLTEYEAREKSLLDAAPRFETPGQAFDQAQRTAMREAVSVGGFAWLA